MNFYYTNCKCTLIARLFHWFLVKSTMHRIEMRGKYCQSNVDPSTLEAIVNSIHWTLYKNLNFFFVSYTLLRIATDLHIQHRRCTITQTLCAYTHSLVRHSLTHTSTILYTKANANINVHIHTCTSTSLINDHTNCILSIYTYNDHNQLR